jgi:hypothetical protein
MHVDPDRIVRNASRRFRKAIAKPPEFTVIACDKREAFAQGSEATKQSSDVASVWIASLCSQ